MPARVAVYPLALPPLGRFWRCLGRRPRPAGGSDSAPAACQTRVDFATPRTRQWGSVTLRLSAVRRNHVLRLALRWG